MLREQLCALNPGPDGQPWLNDERLSEAIAAITRLGAHKLIEANQKATELLIKGLTAEGLPGWDGGRSCLETDALPTAREHFIRRCSGRAMAWLSSRIAGYQSRMEVGPAGVKVQDLGYRWSSCGKGDWLYFRWKAILLPARIAEYVVSRRSPTGTSRTTPRRSGWPSTESMSKGSENDGGLQGRGNFDAPGAGARSGAEGRRCSAQASQAGAEGAGRCPASSQPPRRPGYRRRAG